MARGQVGDHVCRFSRYAGHIQLACSRQNSQVLCLSQQASGAPHQAAHAAKHSKPLERGEFLFRAGAELVFIAVVRTGCLKRYLVDREGNDRILNFAFPGNLVGLEDIHARRHTANVVALQTSAICRLSFQSIGSLSRDVPKLHAELFRTLSSRISVLEVNGGILNADQRIARFLLMISENYVQRGYSGSELHLPMTRQEVASYLRLAPETVSRVLARFQKDGVLLIDRKQVNILNEDELRIISI